MPGKLKQIDAGDGQVYGVNEKDEIFRWVDNNWKQVPGELSHVSVGPSGVWGVDKDFSVYKFQDNDWMAVTGQLKQVDAGGEKFLGGVNEQDNIFCLRQSCTMLNASTVTFSSIEGGLKYYSCGRWGCWGVNNRNEIFYRQNVNPKACKGSQWQQVEGKLTMVEVATDGSVYGISPDGDVLKREGISDYLRNGTTWTQLDFCATFKHVTYDNGNLWLINTSGDIYRCRDDTYRQVTTYHQQWPYGGYHYRG
ncbi:fish-egg lectin-like [Gastrophryne carolinensis]